MYRVCYYYYMLYVILSIFWQSQCRDSTQLLFELVQTVLLIGIKSTVIRICDRGLNPSWRHFEYSCNASRIVPCKTFIYYTQRWWWWWVHLSCVSSGADPGAGRWQGGGASIIRFTKWTNRREGSSGAFSGSHRNHRESVRTPVCPEHHEEDEQPAGRHSSQMNSTTHNALLLLVLQQQGSYFIQQRAIIWSEVTSRRV